METKKSLIELIESDYIPLKKDKEGRLHGGFGAVVTTMSLDKNSLEDNHCMMNVFCTNVSRCIF